MRKCFSFFKSSFLLFTLPYLVTVLLDSFVLGRQYYHHVGDYLTHFSLALGWLDGLPFVYHVWPIWGYSQLLAVLIFITGHPVHNFSAFSAAVALLNFASVILASWILDRELKYWKLPSLYALIIGLVVFSFPPINSGWNHSNPYFFLGVLLAVTAPILVRKVDEPEGTWRVHEVIAIICLGFIVANNFSSFFIVLATFLTYLPRALFRKYAYNGYNPMVTWRGNSPPSKRSRVLLALALAAIFIPILFVIISRRLPIELSIAAIVMSIFAVVGLIKAFGKTIGQVFFLLTAGWLLGANVLFWAYLEAAIRALNQPWLTNQQTAPLDESMLNLGSEPIVIWHFIAPALVALSMFMLVVLATRKSVRAALSEKATLYVCYGLVLSCVVSVATGHSVFMPVTSDPINYSLAGRYNWIMLTAIVPIIYAMRTLSGRLNSTILVIIVCFGIASYFEAYRNKELMVKHVQGAIVELDKLINDHLEAKENNYVFIANAYYPVVSMHMYAYHNARVGLINSSFSVFGLNFHRKPTVVDNARGGRIIYVGRIGGSLWRDPQLLAKSKGVGIENVLLIAEFGDYPENFEDLRTYEDLGVVVYSLRPDAEYVENIK